MLTKLVSSLKKAVCTGGPAPPPPAYKQSQLPAVEKGITRVPQPDDDNKDKDLIAVVVTLLGGSSYDELFTEAPQTNKDGKISVYQVMFDSIPDLHAALHGDPLKGGETDLAQLLKDVREVEPDSVVFNFECCSSCSEQGFSMSGHKVVQFVRLLLDEKFMVMFSDFALKALIKEWDKQLLGRNVLRQEGLLHRSMSLEFSPDVLKQSPSSQLEAVGRLCSEGHVTMLAMPDTIVYTVQDDKENGVKDPATDFSCQVLTVVVKKDNTRVPLDAPGLVEANGKKGYAGHVLLKYPSGGVLLFSAGHWVELESLDTNEEKLKEAVLEHMGEHEYQTWEAKYKTKGMGERKTMIQQKAKDCISRSAPCRYTKKNYTS